MKRYWVLAVALAIVLAVGGYVAAQQFGGPGRGGWMGMGPGMMGGGGPGYGQMGPGMMGGSGPGYGHMGGMMGWGGPGREGGRGQTPTGPVTKEQATTWIQNYLTAQGNPNLKVGAVKETPTQIEVEIVTKDNSLVEKVLVDKNTGRTTRAF